MDETREPASQALAVAEDLLKHVDLERLGTYATTAATAIVLVRRHPWLLIAAGATAAAVGVWQLSRKQRKAARDKDLVLDGYLESENGSRN